MSETRDEGQQGTSGPSQRKNEQGNNPPPRSGQGRTNGQSKGSDPLADFQRWLMKAGARSVANQVADQVKRTVGAERRDSGDVWDTATNEVPPGEPPECQYCPICQAARAARNGGAAGLGAQLANAGAALGSVVQDAFSIFEQALKTQDQNRPAERTGASAPQAPAPDRGEDRRGGEDRGNRAQ